MLSSDPNITVILLAVVLIVSYLLDMLAKRTNVPNVLMLILFGVLIHQGLECFQVDKPNFSPVLEVLGIVGLIMIVLEAALDLELSKEKRITILSSLGVALFSLLITSGGIAALLHFLLIDDIIKSLVYAIPLSILSSAIVIPSVGGLPKEKREYMVYDGTFSDILGIMFFYFLLEHAGNNNYGSVAISISSNILITVALSVVLSFSLILFFQKLKSHLKLFLMVAVLWLFYSVGKLLHLSSLLIILVFGLILNNHRLFFKGFIDRFRQKKATDRTLKDLRLITVESAFVVRTFFFVIFGFTIPLASLVDLEVAFISFLIVLIIYLIRFAMLKVFRWKSSFPERFIAPRGLITILLFNAIPGSFQSEAFSEGILLYPILVTSIVMAVALVRSGNKIEAVPGLTMTGSNHSAPVRSDGSFSEGSQEEEGESSGSERASEE